MLSDLKYIKAILDNSPECIVLIGKNHEVLAYNKTIQDVLFAYFKRNLQLGDHYYPDFVVDGAKELYMKSFESAIQGERILVQHLTENENTSIWFEYKMNPVYDESGELLGVTLSANNIDDIKKAQIKLAESEDKFKKITSLAPIGIVITDSSLKITFSNYAAQHSFGYTDEELQGRTIIDLIEEFEYLDESSFTVSKLKVRLDSFQFGNEKFKGARKDGDVFNLLLSSSIYFTGENASYIFLVQDISELTEKDHLISEQGKTLKQIAWQQSHIVRAPVAKIIGLLAIMNDRNFSLSEPEKIMLYGYINDSAVELDKIIREMVKQVNHSGK